jgi:two-component system, NtrC family, sensor histidine kinase AtoS
MNANAYTLLFLTGFVAALVATLVFAMMRFAAAARDARRNVKDHDADRVFVAAALQDAMTKLKAQEQAMSARAHDSEHLSEQIVASLTAGLLVVAPDGGVRILNPAGRRLLGIAADAAAVGYRELLAQSAPMVRAIEECLATGAAIVRRTLKIDRGDRVMHFGVTVSPFGAQSGQPHGVICLFADLTTVVELEEQLRLKATLARLGELTAGLAHEFRNGLATIHGYGRLIDPQALPPAYRPYVEGIRQETDSLQKIVTNFLNFARPEQLTLQPVDLGAIVQRAAEDVFPPDGTHGALTVEGRFVTVPGDDVMLRQAFNNLLRNAVEACEGAGVAPQVRVIASVDTVNRIAHVAVEDNGPGIPEAQAEKVFAPFFTTKGHGTGLGLALVQKIVVTHSGRVSVGRSTAGGARVQVSLPLEPTDLPSTAVVNRTHDAPTGAAKIT